MSNWINVKTRLPKLDPEDRYDEKDVLVVIDDGKNEPHTETCVYRWVSTGVRDIYGEETWVLEPEFTRDYVLIKNVTYWMEIPKPPKKNGGMDPDISVETPLGTLYAGRTSFGPEYPGIYIDFQPKGKDYILGAVITEVTETESDLEVDTPHLITRIWGNCNKNEYSERIVHKVGNAEEVGND